LAAAAALVIEKRTAVKAGLGNQGELAARGLIATAIVCGLALTHSKGAIAAAVLAIILFVVYSIAGNRLWRHRKKIIVLVFLALIVCGGGVAWYGITHGTLPGGKSMLVRWEYWVGAARAYATHPLTGVGPGGFASYYPTYKIPAALETVKDPHNFVLSILTQYGPLGLVGFLAALLVPLGRMIFSKGGGNERQQDGLVFKKIAISFLLFTAVTLLAIRPLVQPSEFGDTITVMMVVIGVLYIAPAAIFAATFFFLSINEKKTHFDRTTQAVLFCAIAGVLAHNCVDFAIFEPGVYTTLWVLVAIVAAIDFNEGRRRDYHLRPLQVPASLAVAAGFAALWAYTVFCVLPVVKSSIKTSAAAEMMQNAVAYSDNASMIPREASADIMQGIFDYTNRRLYVATGDDPLSPDAPSVSARMCLEFYRIGGQKDEKLLAWAQNRLLVAIRRDPADFKNYERLAEVFRLLADKVPAAQQTATLEQASVAISEAIARYPGSERLRMEAGRIAERLGENDEAVAQYRKAVEIEDSYRIEFAKMYPDKPIFSRMGESEYQFAKKRITELSPPSRE
ncbi:MAG: O-antigen ligase family protein, partial [Sedimentisphaerales bacterium]|nr:O-antigen ligase family protein [Sedimentisphaerales bacterium]